MKIKTCLIAAALGLAGVSLPAHATVNPFIGQLILVGNNFCPAGWQDADGSILPISENDALFNLIGTTYGGDGQETFALPDLRGRAPVHQGTLSGAGSFLLGQQGGAETQTLLANQLPAHNHVGPVKVYSQDGATADGVNNTFARLPSGPTRYTASTPANFMRAGSLQIDATGGNQPISTRDPFLAMRYCISLFGVFPSQS